MECGVVVCRLRLCGLGVTANDKCCGRKMKSFSRLLHVWNNETLVTLVTVGVCSKDKAFAPLKILRALKDNNVQHIIQHY